MKRCKGFDFARETSEKEELSWGLSVADGWYYIGTREELDSLPVVLSGSYEGGKFSTK